MSYPPPPGQDPNNPYAQQPPQPYGQQPPQQPQQPYGYPQQPAQPGGQPAYGYPQQPPQGGIPGQPAYGYPQQAAYGYNPGMQPAYANWLYRVGATLLDGLIVGAPYGILAAIGAGIGPETAAGVIFALLGFLALIGLGLWMIYQEGTTGQTPGKKIVGTRLLGEATGQPIGFGMAFARRLAHILDSLPCYLGWLWPLWDDKKQTFADKICSTVVVRSQ
ncbi:MAG TPA: RDD family protein [Streptomyces sp.]|nr:RDD family protein [Streptomyces sp.]